MIRYVVGLFIFAVVLCAYIINTQHGGILPQSTPDVAEPVAEADAPLAPPTPPEPASEIIDALPPSRDLGYATAPIPVADAVRDTLGVLGLDMGEDIGAPTTDQRFAQIIGAALKTGTPDPQIIAMVQTAAQSGDMAIPAALVRVDGQIDTETYLKSIVTTAVLLTENATPVVPDLSNDPTAVISADGYDYVITETDSLASIAIKFYGDVGQTPRIIAANPIALARPDQMIAGTRISIPAF